MALYQAGLLPTSSYSRITRTIGKALAPKKSFLVPRQTSLSIDLSAISHIRLSFGTDIGKPIVNLLHFHELNCYSFSFDFPLGISIPRFFPGMAEEALIATRAISLEDRKGLMLETFPASSV